MTPDQYWKNFNLGTELDISGRFIYNGLSCFHYMTTFTAEEDVFEFLYQISVGIERLLKIAVILTEHEPDGDQEAFEKTLITHSHTDLIDRIKAHHSLNFGPVHNEFLAILARFYKSHRYGRYSLTSVTAPAQEREDFNAFMEKYLNIKIDTETLLDVTRKEQRHTKFIGRTVGKIVSSVYEIVRNEAGRLNIFTYEIAYASKASKIFHFADFDFEKEDILHMELLVYFMSSSATGDNARFIRDMDPLSFDQALEPDYLAALRADLKKLHVLDELDALYQDEVSNFRERVDRFAAADSEFLSYDIDDEDEADFED